MQSYSSKPMRRHDGTVTTQKTQMAKSEIVILMRYNQNEPEFKQSEELCSKQALHAFVLQGAQQGD